MSAPLLLNANEGPAPAQELVRALGTGPEALQRYPRTTGLEARLAESWGLAPERVLVTAGADDGLARLCQAALGPGRNAVVAAPTFEMIPRYVALARGELRSVSWDDRRPWPLEEVAAACDGDTGLVFAVSPNNPTGKTLGADAVRDLSQRLPRVWVVLDAAYGEFDPRDPSAEVLDLPNVVVLRTFSKAFGLAGLRVGYALAPAAIRARLAQAGHPFPVAGPALAAASLAWERRADLGPALRRVAVERERVALALEGLGLVTTPSWANFVFARCGSADRARDLCEGLEARGVRVRRFADNPELADALRVSCPADDAGLDRLLATLEGLR